MPHPLRWFLPGVVHEVTIRTIQGRFLLRPGDDARDLTLGVLGRGLFLYPEVNLHGFTFLSNHAHLLVSSRDGAKLATFLGYVHGNLARELGRLYGWRGPFWGRRYRPIPIVDETALVRRLRYLLAQAVKEGLVERPEQWPGATSTPWLLGADLAGTWIFRDLETRARRRGGEIDPETYTERYPIRLCPLPGWETLSRAEIAARTRALIDDVVAEARANRSHPPLGVAAVLRQDPHAAPAELTCSPAPVCHASTRTVHEAFRAAYRTFVDAFRTAAAAVKRGAAAIFSAFPPGSFPPAAPFVRPPDLFPLPWLPEPPQRPAIGRGTL
jgi:REP element-mobilizing transposase RayT